MMGADEVLGGARTADGREEATGVALRTLTLIIGGNLSLLLSNTLAINRKMAMVVTSSTQ